MKPLSILPSLIFITLSYVACTEKGSLTPIAKPTVDTEKAAPITQVILPVSDTFPFTDTFVGLLTNTMETDYEGNVADTDDSFLFYAIYSVGDSIVFSSSKGVILSYNNFLNGHDTIKDEFIINKNNSYIYGFNYVPNYYSYSINNEFLTVSWAYSRAMLIGAAYGGESGLSVGQFTGKLKSKPR